MQRSKFWSEMKKLYARYDQMMEKQGFYVVLIVCLLVIAGSAAYTFYFRDMHMKVIQYDTVPEAEPADAAQAETLKEAQSLVASAGAKKAAVPTGEPFVLQQPVHGVVIRDYSADEPQLFAAANYWRIHPGIDLQAEYGTPVKTCESGSVTRVWQDHEKGLCVRVRHEQGFETLYAGLSSADYVRPGDPVVKGQTIGHVGNGVTAETDAPAHLHLEVWRYNSHMDPVKAFLGIAEQ